MASTYPGIGQTPCAQMQLQKEGGEHCRELSLMAYRAPCHENTMKFQHDACGARRTTGFWICKVSNISVPWLGGLEAFGNWTCMGYPFMPSSGSSLSCFNYGFIIATFIMTHVEMLANIAHRQGQTILWWIRGRSAATSGTILPA